jgi:hypothetical protein
MRPSLLGRAPEGGGHLRFIRNVEDREIASPVDIAMKIQSLLPLVLLSACTPAKVTHPTKTPAQMQADINLCTRDANASYWMDPIAALYNAYDCLEAKGYQRDSTHISSQVEHALGEARKKPPGPAKPCTVPCRRE